MSAWAWRGQLVPEARSEARVLPGCCGKDRGCGHCERLSGSLASRTPSTMLIGMSVTLNKCLSDIASVPRPANYHIQVLLEGTRQRRTASGCKSLSDQVIHNTNN